LKPGAFILGIVLIPIALAIEVGERCIRRVRFRRHVRKQEARRHG
jgi:hypothetical protein